MLNDKILKAVAESASKIKTEVQIVPPNENSVEGAVVSIMGEALKGNQHKIDKNKNNKVDSEDFKILRKEEAQEQVQEGWDDMVKAAKDSVKSGPKPSGGSGVKQGTRYGGGKQTSKPEQEETTEEKPKSKKSKFSEMVNTYKEKGLKSLSEMSVKEEDVEQLDELSKDTLNSYVGAAKQDNKDHADSRRSGDKDEAKWAKDRMVKRSTGIGAAQNRLNKEETEIQVIDADLANGVDTVNIQERSLTASETAKREDIVKGMKKSMAGFKERYGKDAKSVMYATATKQAKKD